MRTFAEIEALIDACETAEELDALADSMTPPERVLWLKAEVRQASRRKGEREVPFDIRHTIERWQRDTLRAHEQAQRQHMSRNNIRTMKPYQTSATYVAIDDLGAVIKYGVEETLRGYLGDVINGPSRKALSMEVRRKVLQKLYTASGEPGKIASALRLEFGREGGTDGE